MLSIAVCCGENSLVVEIYSYRIFGDKYLWGEPEWCVHWVLANVLVHMHVFLVHEFPIKLQSLDDNNN